jgi:hypothetical protein
MILRHPFYFLLFILLLSATAFAQTPAAPPKTDEQRKAKQELEQKAINLLEDVIKDSESFKNAENRIRLRASAAYLLWEHDEARARNLFKEVMASFADLLNNPETVDSSGTGRMFDEGPRQLRVELVQMLARRDARLAREFMRATRPPGSQPNSPRNALPDQQLEINLATQIAATDPKQALEMAEENLSRGLSYELTPLLSTLREKDPEAAAKLASEMMAKIRTEKLESSQITRQVALALLTEAAQMPDGEVKNATGVTPLLDQQTLRELTEMLLTEALRPSSTSPELLNSLQEMIPIVEKYAPSRVAQLRRKAEPQKSKESGDGEDAQLDWSKYRPLIEKGSVDELLEAAPKSPEGMRDMLYQRAAGKLIEEGDLEHARQVISEQVKDPDQRKLMLDQVDEAGAVKAAEQGKIEQTRKMLATLRSNEERMVVLAQLATGAAAKGEKKIALQLLDEARGMMIGRAKNFKQLGAQLAVARAYASLDAARSLAMLEPVVDQLNELLAAAVVLGGFITDEIVKDDEVMIGPLLMISGEFLANYLGDVNTLARADFERTRALADRFQRDEVRIIARMLIAQSILAPQPATQKGMDVITRSAGSATMSTEP